MQVVIVNQKKKSQDLSRGLSEMNPSCFNGIDRPSLNRYVELDNQRARNGVALLVRAWCHKRLTCDRRVSAANLNKKRLRQKMVVFTCQKCGDSVKKTVVDKHKFKCGNSLVLTCVDCFKDFRNDEHVGHTSCITESERYGGLNYKPRPMAVKQNEWLQGYTRDIQRKRYAIVFRIECQCPTCKHDATLPQVHKLAMGLGHSEEPDRMNLASVEQTVSAGVDELACCDISQPTDTVPGLFLPLKKPHTRMITGDSPEAEEDISNDSALDISSQLNETCVGYRVEEESDGWCRNMRQIVHDLPHHIGQRQFQLFGKSSLGNHFIDAECPESREEIFDLCPFGKHNVGGQRDDRVAGSVVSCGYRPVPVMASKRQDMRDMNSKPKMAK
ncbi:hypothetical protein AAG570_003330 [Ranatra chinensis]|uniref:Zinc finger C2H2 LYAR-type domain-containing protein n=1 Tax=Ranatra chinensis TaxID=642074 RepID=A0ABD0Y719_9HEMI